MHVASLLVVVALAGQAATNSGVWPPADPPPFAPSTLTDQADPSTRRVLPAAGETAVPMRPSVLPARPSVRGPELPLGVGGAPTAPAAATPHVRATTALELVARAMETPEAVRLEGRPLGLTEALTPVQDARQQLAVVRAYWQSAASVGEYHLRLRKCAILGRLAARPGDEPILRAALASASASADEANLVAVAAQHDLAEQALLPAVGESDLLPVPADRPHVGPYRTQYEVVFAARPAPASAQLLRRTLPLRQAAIDRRAEAVRAAEEAFRAAEDAYARGSAGAERVLSTLEAWFDEERALLRAVRDYNREIAEYAVAALAGPTDAAKLVTMLIPRPVAPELTPLALPGGGSLGEPTPADAARAAGHLEPIPQRSLPPVSEPRRLRDVDDLTPGDPVGEEKLVPVTPAEAIAAPPGRPATAPPSAAGSDPTEAPKLLVVPVEEESQAESKG